MHEIDIASQILRAGQTEAERCPGARLIAVKVQIGVLAGVDENALRFAWDILSQQENSAQPRLEIITMPRRNLCEDCGAEFTSSATEAVCPVCNSRKSFLLGGDELQLACVEVEE
jgi:hydrogenase nickel incorporation protein HypA/HybF